MVIATACSSVILLQLHYIFLVLVAYLLVKGKGGVGT